MSEVVTHPIETAETPKEKNRKMVAAAMEKLLTWDRDTVEDHSGGGEFAVRHNWFATILAQAEIAEDWDLLSPRTLERYHELRAKYTDVNYSKSLERHANIGNDIQEMVEFIEQVLNGVE